MFCKYCGNEVDPNMKFCTKCGKPIQSETTAASGSRARKNKVVVPLAQPGQQQPVRPNPTGQSNRQPEPKKKNGPIIALVVIVAVLTIVVVILAVAFFGGVIYSGSSEDTKVEEMNNDDEDDSDDEGIGDGTNHDDNDDDGNDEKNDDSDSQNKSDEGNQQGNLKQEDSDQQTSGQDSAEQKHQTTGKNADSQDDMIIADENAENQKTDNSDQDDIEAATESEDDMIIGDPSDADYVLPYSSARLLTDEDLEPIADDARLLRIARNEIYARNHRKFKDENKNLEPMQPYFDSKEWYDGFIEADDFTDDMLTKIERKNIDLIKAYEAKLN